MAYPIPDFSAQSPGRRALTGAGYLWLGAKLVVGNPNLWGFVAAPAALMAGAFVAGFAAIVWGLPWALAFVWAPGPESAGWVVVLHAIALLVIRALLVVGLGVVIYLSAGLVSSPFNDRLSEHVERILLGRLDEPLSDTKHFLHTLYWSVAHSLVSLAIYLSLMAVLLLANLLPGLGSVIGFVGGALVSAAFFAREAMDGALSRRDFGYRAKWDVVAENWPVALGFGLAVSAVMAIPFVDLLVIPVSVAGGTALYCHLEQRGLVRARAR